MGYWSYNRAAGLVAWLLLAASMLLGIAVRLRGRDRRLPGRYLLELHRHTAVIAVAFVVVHLISLLSDTYVDFTPADLVIPFRSAWSPWAVTWGVFALYLLVIAQVSGQLRRKMPTAWWVWLHRSSYVLIVVATVHGVTAGTDAMNRAVLATAAAMLVVVLVAACYRLVVTLRDPGPPSPPLSRDGPLVGA